MGWSFRKSIGFGPLRLNFSKSGVGASVGVPGARFSYGPRGTYINLGKDGIYYRQRLHARPAAVRSPYRSSVDMRGVTGPEEILETADVSRLTDSTADAILDRINEAVSKTSYWPFLAIGTILAVAGLAERFSSAAVFASMFGLGATAYASVWDTRRRTIPLFYELSEDAGESFDSLNAAIGTLASAQRLWRVIARQANFDWKRHAGAGSLIRRTAASIVRKAPRFVATNVSVFCLSVNDFELYFFPDRVLVRSGRRFGAVAYGELSLTVTGTRFIEDESVPSDAEVVDHTWRYVRRDGGPDRRFANNRRLPIALYGLLRFQSRTGLDLHLHVSSQRIASDFVRLMPGVRDDRVWSQPRPGLRGTSRTAHKPMSREVTDAYATFAVPAGSSYELVERAYRSMARYYHPDMVNHLAPEFRQLATSRMQDLNVARDVLKAYCAA